MDRSQPQPVHASQSVPAGNPTPPVRAGLVTPSLNVGGAERWMLDLVSHTPGVLWVGCSCLRAAASPVMLEEMRRRVPVHGFANDAIRPLLDSTDVLVCWGPHFLEQALPADYRGKVVVVSHAEDVPWTAGVIRGAMSRATHWVAVSEAARKPYQGLVAPDKVTVLWNGIAPDRCRPCRPREETRRSLGLDSHQIVVGSIGRVANAKRPRLIADAMTQLGPPYWALFVGPWMLREPTPTQIAEALRGRFTLLPETLDVADLLAAIDVFVLASSAEGFGLAVCEALYAGVRVVSARVGVLLDIAAEHGVQWEEIPADATPDDLAAAIRAAATTPAHVLQCRQAIVRRAIEEKYLATAMGRRWGDYLRRITLGEEAPSAAQRQPVFSRRQSS